MYCLKFPTKQPPDIRVHLVLDLQSTGSVLVRPTHEDDTALDILRLTAEGGVHRFIISERHASKFDLLMEGGRIAQCQ